MIFILGGRGFVGSAFSRVCAVQRRAFAIIDRQNYPQFVGKACSILINANGNSKKYLAAQRPQEDFDASARSVYQSLLDFQYDRYVYLSSCDVYPNTSSPLTTSEDSHQDVSRQSVYGFHKYLAELCVRHHARKWSIVRFGGFVGLGLKKNPIFDILRGGPLWLDPDSELQFIHSDRAAEIVLGLLDRGIGNDVFNVCGHGVLGLREVITWADRTVLVQPGSPRVRHEVDLRKISALVELPETRPTVREFVQAALGVPITE